MSFDDHNPPGRSAAAPAMGRAADRVDADTERNLAVLARLRDAGLDAALALKDRVVLAAAEGKTDDKAAKALALVTRTVEQVVLLHQETAGLREKRRASLLAERKAKAKHIVRRAIEREDTTGAAARTPQAERERRVRSVQLDDLFRELDEDIFEGRSVAEVVEHACKLFGVEPDPTLRWPEWAELAAETPARQATDPPPAPRPRPAAAQRPIPPGLSGASSLSLIGRPSPERPFDSARERGPP